MSAQEFRRWSRTAGRRRPRSLRDPRPPATSRSAPPRRPRGRRRRAAPRSSAVTRTSSEPSSFSHCADHVARRRARTRSSGVSTSSTPCRTRKSPLTGFAGLDEHVPFGELELAPDVEQLRDEVLVDGGLLEPGQEAAEIGRQHALHLRLDLGVRRAQRFVRAAITRSASISGSFGSIAFGSMRSSLISPRRARDDGDHPAARGRLGRLLGGLFLHLLPSAPASPAPASSSAFMSKLIRPAPSRRRCSSSARGRPPRSPARRRRRARCPRSPSANSTASLRPVTS